MDLPLYPLATVRAFELAGVDGIQIWSFKPFSELGVKSSAAMKKSG